MKALLRLKHLIGVLGFILFCQYAISQTTIILQPDSVDGKDASVSSYYPTTNFGAVNTIDNEAHSHSGTEFFKRNLFTFDLSQLPSNIIITDAKLSLYYSPQLDGGTHETFSGSNACVIQRVTSGWDEALVTWNNQPSSTNVNEVSVPMSTNDTMDYPNLDVTALVQEMIDNPTSSFGFLMKLDIEQKYRRLVFASSDHIDGAKHPKLEITFTEDSVNCMTFQPNSIDGKDVTISSYYADSSFYYVNTIDNEAHSHSGTDFFKRNFFTFDLSQLPTNINISDAKLSLFYSPQPDGGTHETLSGSNACLIQRITSPWDETTASWNNQPSVTSVNEVEVPMSTSNTQDYPDIIVTDLVRDMINNPGSSYGFGMKLKFEQKYRRLVFASSEHANSSKHPKLVVCYSIITSVKEDVNNTITLNIYPNPTNDIIHIELNKVEDMTLEILNLMGQVIIRKEVEKCNEQINISEYPSGVYIVKIQSRSGQQSKRVIKY